MISNTVANAAQSLPAAQSKQVNTKPTQSAPQPTPNAPTNTPNATVQVSNAAKALLQEAIETPVQTAQEARGGDLQAQRLLAREAAEKAANK